MAVASLPLVIQNSLNFLSAYLLSAAVAFGRSGERHRAMRSDRRENIKKVVEVLLRSCSLQFDGIFCHFSWLWVRPLTIPEIARYAGLSVRTVARCLADLVDLGLIECKQIKRKNHSTGQIEVSAGLRKFTKKFWKALGLWEAFEKGKAWAQANGKRKFMLPFKGISAKIKSTVKSAGQLVKSVLSGLGGDDAQRVKFHCDKIRERIRQRK